jgi:hypothetical protein
VPAAMFPLVMNDAEMRSPAQPAQDRLFAALNRNVLRPERDSFAWAAQRKMLPMAKDPMKWDGKVYRQVSFGDDGSIKGTAKEAELKMRRQLPDGEMLLPTGEHWRRLKRLAMQDCHCRSALPVSSWTSRSDDHGAEAGSGTSPHFPRSPELGIPFPQPA